MAEILQGDAYLKGEVFPGQHEDVLHAVPGQIIRVIENNTAAILAEITFEMELVQIRAGKGLKTRVEEALERLGQKMRYEDGDPELIIIVQLTEL